MLIRLNRANSSLPLISSKPLIPGSHHFIFLTIIPFSVFFPGVIFNDTSMTNWFLMVRRIDPFEVFDVQTI